MSPFYTTRGDDGTTGLLGEGRVAKDHPQIEAVGALDEATAAIGVARSICQTETCREVLPVVQRDLYNLMAETAATPQNASRFRKIDEARVAWLEEQADRAEKSARMPSDFILPGDSPAGAALALARTVVRRAERRLVSLFHGGAVTNPDLLRYLNRLSSLLFAFELLENEKAGSTSPTLAKE